MFSQSVLKKPEEVKKSPIPKSSQKDEKTVLDEKKAQAKATKKTLKGMSLFK